MPVVNVQVAFVEQVVVSDDNIDLTVEEWLAAKTTEGLLDFDMVHRIMRALELPPDAVVSTLSHGLQFKLRLCANLLRPGVTLLLLDEPTSHLDLWTVLFLETFVHQCGIACLIVSHDARFLQATVNVILELDSVTHSLRSTTASFDDYLLARERQRHAALVAEEKREKRVTTLEVDAARLRHEGASGARYQTGDRDKLLRDHKRERSGRSLHSAGVKERQIQRTLKQEGDADVPGDALGFELDGLYPYTYESVMHDSAHSLSLIDSRFGYDDESIFGPLSLSVSVGEKVMLLGPNGSGKSTVLSLLSGALTSQSGVREVGHSVRVGMLHQDADCGLNVKQTPLDALTEATTIKPDTRFGVLYQVGITREASVRPIADLSPGLTVRLALLLLVVQGVNLLLLDEVTNFVDRSVKERLY